MEKGRKCGTKAVRLVGCQIAQFKLRQEHVTLCVGQITLWMVSRLFSLSPPHGSTLQGKSVYLCHSTPQMMLFLICMSSYVHTLFVCMYMCVCVYIYIYKLYIEYIYISYIYRIYIYAHNVCVCVCVCVCVEYVCRPENDKFSPNLVSRPKIQNSDFFLDGFTL